MAEGIMELIDSMPDEGPPADAGDTSSPNFGQGMSIPQMYEILEPLARMIAEQTGEDVQSILQEMITDPTAIGRAKSMLGMDETTPFPNNIREPMQTPQTQGIPSTVFENMSPAQQSKILGMGDTITNIDLPQGRPTMSERLLSQMSLKD
tara:strand:- start:3608 stop:4057 length:450 start_codon:yes stop_codon:yes gene_type:complete